MLLPSLSHTPTSLPRFHFSIHLWLPVSSLLCPFPVHHRNIIQTEVSLTFSISICPRLNKQLCPEKGEIRPLSPGGEGVYSPHNRFLLKPLTETYISCFMPEKWEDSKRRSSIKGVSFQRNCGAASVRECNRIIKIYQMSW